MYSVIASDLDGTLLNHNHQVSPFTRKTIHQLLTKDYKFIIATGRHYQDVKRIRELLDIQCFLITCNGAMVHDKDDQLIYNQSIAPDIAAELFTIQLPKEIHANLYQGNDWFVEQPRDDLLKFSQDSGFSYTQRPFSELSVDNVSKFFFVGTHQQLLPLEQQLRQQFGNRIHIAFSLPHCLEVMDAKVNKGSALKAVLDIKGLPLQDCITFGDGMNDYEMLRDTGLGVLMDNAHDLLKQKLIGHPVAPSCDQDGVAQYLNQLLLENSLSQSA